MSWNPEQYLKFGSERLRPAVDLLARVPLEAPAAIADLGCGTGTVTALLRARWPGASVIGIDNAPDMLERARASVPGATFRSEDLAAWRPEAPVDLIVSNAALQWLDDHAALFPRLLEGLRPGGVLAVQMPAQHDARSHRIGYDLAEKPPWKARLAGMVRRRPLLDAAAYYALLRPRTASLELWFAEYIQVLHGEDPVVEFTKGSFVGQWLAALPPAEAAAFEAAYRPAVRAAYPPEPDGATLFPFRRFFLVARTPG